jgi:hypothetical protein
MADQRRRPSCVTARQGRHRGASFVALSTLVLCCSSSKWLPVSISYVLLARCPLVLLQVIIGSQKTQKPNFMYSRSHHQGSPSPSVSSIFQPSIKSRSLTRVTDWSVPFAGRKSAFTQTHLSIFWQNLWSKASLCDLGIETSPLVSLPVTYDCYSCLTVAQRLCRLSMFSRPFFSDLLPTSSRTCQAT